MSRFPERIEADSVLRSHAVVVFFHPSCWPGPVHDKDPQIEQLDWVPIPAELTPGLTRRPLSKRQLKQWTLVLQARGISVCSEKDGRYRQLLVPAARFQDACRELAAYEKENRDWPPSPPPERTLHYNTASTIWVLILLALFHNLAVHQFNPFGHGSLDWSDLGNAEAGRIMAGEWWRALTALTLHAGPLHLIGNIVVGGVFITRLCWILGSGSAWLLVLTGGIGGNLLNALVQSPAHRSVGASTAVFGAIALLATINMLHYRRALWKRWPLPVAAALGVLALLGAGGDNTDIGAHLFGFFSGVGLGLTAGNLLQRYKTFSPSINRLSALAAALLLVLAWTAALNSG